MKSQTHIRALDNTEQSSFDVSFFFFFSLLRHHNGPFFPLHVFLIEGQRLLTGTENMATSELAKPAYC